MLDLLLFLLKVFGLPLAIFILLRQTYKLSAHLSIISKLKVPLNIAFILASAMLMIKLAEMPILAYTDKVISLLLYFVILYVVIRGAELIFVEEVLRRRNVHIPGFIRDIIRFVLVMLAITLLLKFIFGIEPTAFIVTSTVISAVIGLALQDMLANVISGVALQIERPFEIGDWVRINDRDGRIAEMSWRTTKLRTRQNDYIIIPNTTVATHEIYNFYAPTKVHQILMYIGASYKDAPNRVKASLMAVLSDVKTVLHEPASQVFVVKYNDFSIDYELRFWIADYEILPAVQDEVMTRIWYQFRRDEIQIPYPIRDINITHHEARQQEAVTAYQKLLDDIVESIHDIDILQPFSREKLYELARAVRHAVYAGNEYLVHQGDHDSSFYIIKSGRVEVLIKQEDGGITSVGTFGEDYYFGEISLLTGAPRSASVIARMDTEALIIDKSSFGLLLQANPTLAEALSEILHQRTHQLEKIHLDASEDRARRQQTDQKAESKKLLQLIQRFFNLV